MSIKQATKKPITIDFMEWTGENPREMHDFLTDSSDKYMESAGDHFYIDHGMVGGGLVINTSEGSMEANIGDFIIKEPFDKDRKFYPCKPDIFALTYDIN